MAYWLFPTYYELSNQMINILFACLLWRAYESNAITPCPIWFEPLNKRYLIKLENSIYDNILSCAFDGECSEYIRIFIYSQCNIKDVKIFLIYIYIYGVCVCAISNKIIKTIIYLHLFMIRIMYMDLGLCRTDYHI